MLVDIAMVRTQNPVILNNFSEPEPDIAVVKVKENYYADRHPSPEDILLIIEVADSSLEKGREAKLLIYAAARIPEYWIVNLETKEIEVYQSPEKELYRSRRIYFSGDKIEINQFNLICQVDDLLI